MKPYGHFTVSSNEGLLVTDGIIDAKSIHLCHADWKAEKLSWSQICEHNSSFSTQDVHPHPIFSHDNRYVLYTSDTHNEHQKGNLYLIEID
jgi:oligogalacturonide lyase